MQDNYLEITTSRGKVIAAYYHLPRLPEQKSARSKRHEKGLIVDYAEDDTPIGIEITAPSQVTLEAFNRVLEKIGQPLIEAQELKLLSAA